MHENEAIEKKATGIEPSEQLIQQHRPSIYETYSVDRNNGHGTHASQAASKFSQTKIYHNNYNRWDIYGEEFDLPSNFTVMEYMGAGAYGIVVSALDKGKNTTVAIKKCRNIFQSKTLAKRTLRELRLLRLIDHPNIIKIKSVLRPIDCSNFLSVYIIFDLMESDLASIIRSSQPLNDRHIHYFISQLLSALQYLHVNNIVHRDIKPRNILVNSDCLLKLADFGLARYYNENINDSKIMAMTEYVTTRWYRAPEILVGWQKYSSAIDIWAVGCIVAELIGRTPILPGCDSRSQIDCICKLMGKPNILFIKQAKKPQAKQYLYDLPQCNPVNLSTLFPTASSLLLDLMSQCFKYMPDERITATQALQHPYIKRGRWLPTFSNSLKIANNQEEFSFETEKHTIDLLRQQLLAESMYYESMSIVPPLLDSRQGANDDITDRVSSDGNIDDVMNEESARSVSSEREECKESEPVAKASPKNKKQVLNPHAYVAKSPPHTDRTCNVM